MKKQKKYYGYIMDVCVGKISEHMIYAGDEYDADQMLQLETLNTDCAYFISKTKRVIRKGKTIK